MSRTILPRLLTKSRKKPEELQKAPETEVSGAEFMLLYSTYRNSIITR